MKFISNISIHGGLSVPFLTNLFSNICDIEVTDDVTGEVFGVPATELSRGSYLGFVDKGLGGCAVKHDKRAVTILKYIEKVEVLGDCPPDYEDFVFVPQMHAFKSESTDTVFMESSTTSLCGKYNEIAYCATGTSEFCTLYDLLCRLCLSANCCLMLDRVLLIYNPQTRDTLRFTFMQNDDARAFFMKIYLECKR